MNVYCNCADCLHYEELLEKKILMHHKGYIPIGDDGYSGICVREEIGISRMHISTNQVDYRLAKCVSKSDKRIAGHMDWSKFPQGGNIG